MKWTNKGNELDHIKELSLGDLSHQYGIWGAGTFGEGFFRQFHSKINLAFFIDANPKKQGTLFCGLPVYPPSYLEGKEKECRVLVSAGWTKEIFSQLNALGYEKNKDCFHIDEFSTIFTQYKEHKIGLSFLSFPVTDCCSLKCKHCSGFTPYIPKPIHHPLPSMKEDLAQLFSVVDRINVFALASGDTMVHPKFNDILRHIGEEYYGSRIGSVEVFTNAVLLPTPEQLALFQKYHVFVRFSNYGVYASHKQKIEEMIELLTAHSISYDRVEFNHWLDTGYPQASNGITGEKALEQFFNGCDRRSCASYFQGEFYYCNMIFGADRMGYCEKSPQDTYKLAKINPENPIEFLEFMLGYSEKGYYEYCKKCNGSFNVNTKQIPVGEQLPPS